MHAPSSSPTAIKQIDILWITAGLGCDGDTIALTAATQPSLEELLLGGIPGIPTVKFHNPFLSIENGDEFMQLFHTSHGRLASPESRQRFDTGPNRDPSTLR